MNSHELKRPRIKLSAHMSHHILKTKPCYLEGNWDVRTRVAIFIDVLFIIIQARVFHYAMDKWLR